MYFKRGSTSYWYEIHGEGTPVMLLHGFTGNVETWHPFVQQWKNTCQLIIIDLPGHGKTKASNITMEDCCNHIKQLLDSLSLHKVHMVGYSMGGRTALSFAMTFPGSIQSLVLESASPGLKEENARLQRQKQDAALVRMIEQDGVEHFVAYWEEIPLFSTQKQLPKDVQQTIRNVRLSQSREGLVSSLQYMGTGVQPSWWHVLSTFNKPVLLIAGEYDEKYVSTNTIMHEQFLHSDFPIVKNAGHAIHVEQPIIFGKLVMDHIFQHCSSADKKDMRRNKDDSKLEKCKGLSGN